ncbi:hypothetical protein [Dictyobacter aurantiacus]|uniref:hypothetical protein n=1 Tax=Dictyobacter aurantiacus TaxID=1936993 RepID=UPI000F842858|nr:hypothetical protein [Dictyobacter aurantiacus]
MESPAKGTKQPSAGDSHPAQTMPIIPDSRVEEIPQEILTPSPKEETLPALPPPHPVIEAHKAEKDVIHGQGGISIREHVLRNLSRGLGWFINAFATAILSVLLGFAPPVSDVPLLDFIKSHKLTVLVILCVVVFLTMVALLAFYERFQPMDALRKAMGTVTIVSMLSCGLCLSLLWVTLARPSWCLTSLSSLCPASKTIVKPLTSTRGSHDTNLDAYFISFQSATYAIAGNPLKPDYIPSSGNPRSIGVVPLDTKAPSTPYTIAVGVHSLSTGGYSVVIDKVALLVTRVNVVPDPLNVYAAGLFTTYTSTNPSRFVYRGQHVSQMIPDTYSNSPLPRVILGAGESDQIDAAFESSVPVDIQFRIQVTYHILTHEDAHSLTLPQVFEVVFSNVSTWRTYQLNLANQNFVSAP